MLTVWFALMNLAEDNDRVRRIRALDEGPEPRRGSLHEAIAQIAREGTSAAELRDALADAEVRLVMTAHPTEARRRTTVEQARRGYSPLLRSLDDRRPARGEHEQIRRQLAAAVQEMWVSDELRAVSTTVLDEVRARAHLLHVDARRRRPDDLPRPRGDDRRGYPDDQVDVPPLLTFGSWMGGDRDGNPFVTPAMTADALDDHAGDLPAAPPGDGVRADAAG